MLAQTIFAALIGFPCQASVTVVAEWTDPVNHPYSYTATTAFIWGQTFTATSSGILDTVSVYGATQEQLYNIPPDLQYRFYRVSNGNIVAPSVASATVAIVRTNGHAWFPAASFAQDNIAINAGEKYGFALFYDTSNNQYLTFVGSQGYPGGENVYSWDNGFTFIPHQTNTDLGFRITVVPEPSALASVVLGLAALSPFLRKRE